MRLFVLVAALFLSLPAQAADFKVIYFDAEKGVLYKLDKESIHRQGERKHLFVMVEKVKQYIKATCRDRNGGACDKIKDQGECAAQLEMFCPGGREDNYRDEIMWEVTCTGQIKSYPLGRSEKDWYAVQPDTLEAAIETTVCGK